MSLEIEIIIGNNYEWFTDNKDLSNINRVYDVLKSVHDYLDSVNLYKISIYTMSLAIKKSIILMVSIGAS